MKKFIVSLFGLGMAFLSMESKTIDVTITPQPQESPSIVAPEIYGQFAEHLGRCIYGGIWVGEDSDIPNTKGYRNDVIEAFKDLQIPVLRWPGDVSLMNITGWMV